MKDKQFLVWLHQRLARVHGENPHYDYMIKLRAIIAVTNPEQETQTTPSESDIGITWPITGGSLNGEGI